MKLAKFELNGQEYHLLLTGAALFEAYDRFGDKGDMLELMAGTNQESFHNTVWMLVNLCKHGEAYRRYMGEDTLPMLTVEAATRTMGPKDVVRARAAIRQAFDFGFERKELTEEEDVDVGLWELQKKTELASRVPSGLAARLSSWGFRTKKE